MAKVSKRGKYGGVKIHLDAEECEELLQLDVVGGYNEENIAIKFASKLGKKISTLLKEEPNLLKERTPAEIQHELEVELESAQLKLAALAKGNDWKSIHIE